MLGSLANTETEALTTAKARIAELERIGETRQDILEIQESRIHEACEIYAGMEGFIPKYCSEAYLQRTIRQMYEALLGVGDE
jgi:RecB family endonuclease NucS